MMPENMPGASAGEVPAGIGRAFCAHATEPQAQIANVNRSAAQALRFMIFPSRLFRSAVERGRRSEVGAELAVRVGEGGLGERSPDLLDFRHRDCDRTALTLSTCQRNRIVGNVVDGDVVARVEYPYVDGGAGRYRLRHLERQGEGERKASRLFVP